LSAVIAALAMPMHPATSLAGAREVYEQRGSLADDWETEIPGFGKLTSNVRLVSSSQAIEGHRHAYGK
jgi:hypothetical protein